MKRILFIQGTVFSLALLLSAYWPGKEALAQPEQLLDKRVTDSTGYSQLVKKSPWEQGNIPPTDWNQQIRGCITELYNTPGALNARRAQNLAASKHFDEAIKEWSLAIDRYGNDKDPQNTTNLDPEWLICRAQIYLKLGRTKDALADLERSLALKRSSPQEKFHAATVLVALGQFALAESIIPAPSSAQPQFEPYFYYLHAVTQQKQGKNEPAKQNFLKAATLFAATGMSSPAQSCIDAMPTQRKHSEKLNNKLTIADLAPPQSNYGTIKRLLLALASKSDVFDVSILTGLTGATRFIETETQFFANPCDAHFKELSLVSIDKLEGGGKRLNIQLEPVLCSIRKSALKGLLNAPVTVPQTWRKEVAYSDAYRVPAGTLVLTVFNCGFNSIWRAELYSKDANFPTPLKRPVLVKASVQQKSYSRQMAVIDSLGLESLDHAQKVVSEWLQDTPEDPTAHMYQAEILLREHKPKDALRSIEAAIKYSGYGEHLDDKHSGNILQVKKGTCQLEMGDIAEAYATFEKSLPENPSSDQLLLRSRAEIGLKRLADAAKDLQDASKKFYKEGRIVKRDETDKLLNSISSKPDT